MRQNSDFGREAHATRKTRRSTTYPFKKPVQTDKTQNKVGNCLATYQINVSSNILEPKSLPKTGDTVLVQTVACPKDMETNIVYVKELSDKAFVYEAWIPSYNFYLLQLVVFWKSDTQYEYQIQYSDERDPSIGKFVLMSKKRTTRQPGGAYRTPQKTKMGS